MRNNELRIGNLLLVEGDGDLEVRTVLSIRKDTDGFEGYFISHEQGMTSIEDVFEDGDYLVKGIPLTEGWLIKFGIKGMSTKTIHSIFKISPTTHAKDEWVMHIGTVFNVITSQETNVLPLKYVHQLQNLYFALTGEELTIKP